MILCGKKRFRRMLARLGALEATLAGYREDLVDDDRRRMALGQPLEEYWHRRYVALLERIAELRREIEGLRP